MIYNGIEYTLIRQLTSTLLLFRNPVTDTLNILYCPNNKMLFDTLDIIGVVKAKSGCFLYQHKYFGKNYVDNNGKILFPGEWFNTALLFYNGCAIISKDNVGYNVINTKGEYLFNIWFDDIDRVKFNHKAHSLRGLISRFYYRARLDNSNYILDVVNRKIYVEV